jgi:hypothetical protein
VTRSAVGDVTLFFAPHNPVGAQGVLEIPQELCDGNVYPQLTEEAKRKILGENLLGLHGMDVEDI